MHWNLRLLLKICGYCCKIPQNRVFSCHVFFGYGCTWQDHNSVFYHETKSGRNQFLIKLSGKEWRSTRLINAFKSFSHLKALEKLIMDKRMVRLHQMRYRLVGWCRHHGPCELGGFRTLILDLKALNWLYWGLLLGSPVLFLCCVFYVFVPFPLL